VVLEALRAGQHKNIYCGVLRVRKTRYYIKNYSVVALLTFQALQVHIRSRDYVHCACITVDWSPPLRGSATLPISCLMYTPLLEYAAYSLGSSSLYPVKPGGPADEANAESVHKNASGVPPPVRLIALI
jgi:hypothetical protein